ncbi:helix-turn-helix transcriptional regulator [Thalassiella azotivora]
MRSEVSPTARALLALDVLRARPGTTAAELGRRLGVTERAARRYVDILREADVPVESVRGPYGGYRLGRGATPAPVAFSEDEALALVMAVLDSGALAETGNGPDRLVASALDKVVRALPPGVGHQAAMVREHASPAPDRHAARPDAGVTSALVAAVAARRRVSVTYRSAPDREWVTDVDPWAVVVRYGRWYLLCHSHRAGAVRTYRIDRVRDVVTTPHAFDPPDDLDPVAVLEEHLGTGWEHPTRVRFHAPVEAVAPWIAPTMGRLSADGEHCVLEGSTSNPQMYAQEWLARLPFDLTVEDGPELREAVTALAARFAAAVT